MSAPILPGAVLGMLGSGQLGRMFALAARRMGYRVAVYSPERDSPTGQVADEEQCGAYDDLEAVERFARTTSAVTFEFEKVPVEAVRAAGRHVPVRPGERLLEVAQDRLREKQAVLDLGLPVTPFAPVLAADDFEAALAKVGGAGILKTAGGGYDGKGQRSVEGLDGLKAGWEALGRPRAILEQRAAFTCEVSVVGARGLDGSIAMYEPFENHHENHILDVTRWPARVDASTRDQALEATRKLLEALDVVGVLCVEMFVLPDGGLLVNELAPRPHNSGHLTIDAHHAGQFEQQVRAVCGLPLGSTEPVGGGAAMVNLLGDLWTPGEPDWAASLDVPGTHLHLYGKREPKPGRKMGHVTATAASTEEAVELALRARAALGSPNPSPKPAPATP